MKRIELSIITVNFGSKNKILTLYKSLQEFPLEADWEMIIVDNPTKKGGDGEFLAEYFSQEKNVHVIQLSKNMGYGAGNNEGVKFASGEILAICNPDTKVCQGTFDELISRIRGNLEIGIAAPVLKTENGKILENCRKFPSIWSLISRRLFKQKQFINKIPRKNETDWAQGSFWVLRKSIFDKLGGFDDRFFLFMEDIDFCRRVWQNNLKVEQVSKAIAIHSPNRLSGGFIGSAIFRKTFWIHLWSAGLYFWKWH